MAITSSIFAELPHGGRRITMGSFTNGGTDTSGDIGTGLFVVENFTITGNSGTALTNACTTYDTLPLQANGPVSVTINCDSGVSGYWKAIGW